VKKVKSEEKASNEVCDVLTDEFTDTALSTSHNNGTPDSLTKLPSGTVVTNVETKTESDEDKPSTAPHNNINGDANGEEEEDIKLPPGLVISPASGPGLTKVQGEAKVVEVGSKGDSSVTTKVEGDNVIELGSPKTEIVPSLASDATTSTKDTVTPSKSALVTSKGKKPHMPRLVPRQESGKDTGDKSQKDEKTSTVKTVTRKLETEAVSNNSNNGKTRQSKRDSDNDEESSLTSLDVDIDNEDLEEDDENNEMIGVKRVSVKLSAILPKPTKSRNSTPASSSRKGMPSKPLSKPGDKRKRPEEPSAASKQSKKAKLSEDEEAPGTPETGGAELLSGTSSSGRVRRVKKIFDL